MSSNTLTITVFLLGSALLLGVEAVKTNGRVRYTFGGGACAFVLVSLFWASLSAAFPVAARQIASVAQNPSSWFVLLIAIFLVARGWWTKRPTLEATAAPASGSLSSFSEEKTAALYTGLSDLAERVTQAEVEVKSLRKSADSAIDKVALQVGVQAGKIADLTAKFDGLRGDQLTANTIVNNANNSALTAEAKADAALLLAREQSTNVHSLEKTVDGLLRSREAQKTRCALDSLKAHIDALDQTLFFPDGVGVQSAQWDNWQRIEHQWRSTVKQWAFHASRYTKSSDLVAEIMETPQDSFYGDWSFKDSDMPNADTIHRYKAFCIMRRNLEGVRADIDNAVWAASYSSIDSGGSQ